MSSQGLGARRFLAVSQAHCGLTMPSELFGQRRENALPPHSVDTETPGPGFSNSLGVRCSALRKCPQATSQEPCWCSGPEGARSAQRWSRHSACALICGWVLASGRLPPYASNSIDLWREAGIELLEMRGDWSGEPQCWSYILRGRGLGLTNHVLTACLGVLVRDLLCQPEDCNDLCTEAQALCLVSFGFSPQIPGACWAVWVRAALAEPVARESSWPG